MDLPLRLFELHHFTRQWEVNPRGFDVLSHCPKHFVVGSDLSGELLGLRHTVLAAYGSALVIDDNHAPVCESE